MRVSPNRVGSPFQRQSSGANLVKSNEFGRQSRNVGRILCPVTLHRLPKRIASRASAGYVDPTPFESSSWDDVDGMCLDRVYTVVSGCCKVVLTIFVEGFDMHAGKFWKACMKVFKQGMMSRKPGRGKCSVCCRSCCSANRQGRAVWAKQSCAVV